MEKFLQRSSHTLRSTVKSKKQIIGIALTFASLCVFVALALRRKDSSASGKTNFTPPLSIGPQIKTTNVITTPQPIVALQSHAKNVTESSDTPYEQVSATSLHTYNTIKHNTNYTSAMKKYALGGTAAILLGGLIRNRLNSQEKEYQEVSEKKEDLDERVEDINVEEDIEELEVEKEKDEKTKDEVDQKIMLRFRHALHRKNELKAEIKRLKILVNERRTALEDMNNRNKFAFDTNAGLLMHIQMRQDAFAEMNYILTIVLAEENLLTKTLQTTKTNHDTIVSSHNTKKDCDMHCKYRSLLRPLVLHHLVKTRFPSQLGSRARQAAFGFSFMGLVNSIPPFTPFMINKLPVRINDAIRFTLPINTNAGEALLNIGGYALSQSFKPEEKGFILLARYHYFASELQKLQRQDETIAAMLSELLNVYNDSNSMYGWLDKHKFTDEFKEIKKEEEQWL